MKRVGIVICNYNKADWVVKCIQSVLESKYKDFDLYVVDNASPDDSVDRIQKEFDGKLTLIENAENLGGSGGFDTGLITAMEKPYEYLMCIDNDALLDENAVGALVDFLDDHPETGIAASKIYHMEKPWLVQNFGQNIDFDNFCTSVPYLNHEEDGTMPDFVYTDSVPACSLMIRRSVIDEIGVMPRENFIYWDDTEWCYLCNKAGYKVASVGASKALHSMGAKKEYLNTFPVYYGWRNLIAFFARYSSEENYERMADNFIGGVFYVQFAGWYKGETAMSSTVMAAFDDALDGVSGPAHDGIIQKTDHNRAGLASYFTGNKAVIFPNGYRETAEFYAELPELKSIEFSIMNVDDITNKSTAAHNSSFSEDPVQKGIAGTGKSGIQAMYIVESLFYVTDKDMQYVQELEKNYDGVIIADLNECAVLSTDIYDLLKTYTEAKDVFVTALKPEFLRKLKKAK
ncbi:MAG: glycosyltransferase family 2 protein [Lachnospiraceae bacterium]|nr:glycosyltransferase family 2 protein [Lachnospiraceae bacterium]MEE3461540.1 glycosyltransferase family 2 protein [Lachnospiraceae bacterium]